MNAKLRVNLNSTTGGFGFAELETEIHFVPMVGMEFFALPWSDGKEVRRVTYSVEDDELLIYLAPDEMRDEDIGMYATSYRSRGWTLVGIAADL